MTNQTAGSKEFESINIKINKAIITSNQDESRSVDLRASDVVEYREHMFRDSVEVSFIFSDTGNTLDGKSLSEALPLQTTENFEFEIQDAKERKLKINLNVNKVTPILKDQQKENILLTLTSEEFIKNEMYSSSVNERYDGKISDHVKSIIENNLKSKIKEENLEITANNFNFIGNKRKAFYIIRWLSKKCIPVANGKMGDTAGFAFYQTSDGYHFKSIDSLFAQKTKRKYAFTGVAEDVSQKYDAIVAKFSSNLNITANNKLRAGAYNTKLIVFDPFNCFYQVIDQDAEETKSGTTLAGKNLPVLNKKFTQETTRTTYMIKDTGTLPSGDVKQQIDKNEEETFEIEKILNQSIRRFNQLDCATMEIVIPTDFNLHVGDTVRVDTRSLKNNTAGDGIDKTVSGKYLIFAITHRISNNKGSTKLGLVRDSIGRVAENTGMME
jgi:hypothetical protein|tara:strand:- start:74 stop:1396 length:1323 start_codon:yes stop_codon:yes gene_type:complete